jgi:hypothetical protein
MFVLASTFLIWIAIALIFSFILGLPIMLLWDWLMPTIFGLPEITWVQAVGLSLLSSLLIKSHSPAKSNE